MKLCREKRKFGCICFNSVIPVRRKAMAGVSFGGGCTKMVGSQLFGPE